MNLLQPRSAATSAALPSGRQVGRWGLAVCLFIIWSLGRSASAAPTAKQLADQFDAAHYSDLLSNALYARQGMNRLAVVGAQHDLCRDSIYTQFLAAGLSPVMDCFTFQDSNNVARTACNVIAVLPGVRNPDQEIYVAGGHYDSKNNAGADDNGTGIACLLEMARIFRAQPFAKTLVLVAFDGEEIWDYYGAHRLGSVQYAGQHWGDNIQRMVSIDMIGWQSATIPNTAYIYGRSGSIPIQLEIAAAARDYGGLATVIRSNYSAEISDHVAFADAGFQACLLIEGAFSGNPNYHKAGDYVDQANYIDWDYVAKMSRTAIGYFAEKLQPVDLTPVITGIAAGLDGAMEVRISGLAGCSYVTEWSPDLGSGLWAPLSTNAAATDGTWVALDANAGHRPRGFYRARLHAGASAARVRDIILDNTGAVFSGDWSRGTSSTDKLGSDYRFAAPGGGAYADYRPNLGTAGNYDVYERHPQGTNRTTDAPIEVVHGAGSQTVRINQQTNGGIWMWLGRFNFPAGTASYVRIRNDFTTGSVVMADGIKFVYAPE